MACAASSAASAASSSADGAASPSSSSDFHAIRVGAASFFSDARGFGAGFGGAGFGGAGFSGRPRRSPYGGRYGEGRHSEGAAISSVESEFAQHAAELQDEVNDLVGDLLSDLNVHLSARGSSGF